jgi:hypothetical protein
MQWQRDAYSSHALTRGMDTISRALPAKLMKS